MAQPDLAFFNSLSGKLEIKLSIPPHRYTPNLENLQASPHAKVVNLKLVAEVYEKATKTFRNLTADELNSVAFRGSEIKLRNDSGRVVSHKAPNGKYFTVLELLGAVVETERQTRDDTEWLEGVDVHHVFFEGIHEAGGGVWEIYWGS
jgi:hypothetical protein